MFSLFGTVVRVAAALHFAMVVLSCGGLVCFSVSGPCERSTSGSWFHDVRFRRSVAQLDQFEPLWSSLLVAQAVGPRLRDGLLRRRYFSDASSTFKNGFRRHQGVDVTVTVQHG